MLMRLAWARYYWGPRLARSFQCPMPQGSVEQQRDIQDPVVEAAPRSESVLWDLQQLGC